VIYYGYMTWRVAVLSLLLFTLLAQPVLAQQPDTLEQLISSFYNGAVRIVGLAAFLMLLYAGIIRMLPFGSPEQSNQIIQDVVIGTVLLLSAVIILNSINPDLTNQSDSFSESLIKYRANPGDNPSGPPANR